MLKEEIEKALEAKLPKDPQAMSYNQWLEFFRKIPAGKLMSLQEFLMSKLPIEGFAAASRWIEIAQNPSKMDKLYQGQLSAEKKKDIKKLAIGDDDEAFYEALILENVEKLDESRNSAQEVARITQNLNIFRRELREIRSRKPKKGTVLEKVLRLSSRPPEPPKIERKKLKTTKKGSGCEKKTKKSKSSNSSRASEPAQKPSKG